MALHEQRWIPDTCFGPAMNDACSFIEVWDDAEDPVSRTYTFVRCERKCQFHAPLSDQAAFTECYEWNHRKNFTLLMATTTKPALDQDLITWTFTADGVLHVHLASNLTVNQRTNLQNQLDVQFGAGRVVID